MFKDILLPLPCHPTPAGPAALGRALEAARRLEAHVTGLVVEPTIPLPVAFRPYGAELERELGVRQAEVRAAARAGLAAFAEEARRAGLSHDGQTVTVADGAFDAVVEHARLRGLTVAPFVSGDESHADLLQALIFESGRPVLILPEEGEGFRLDRIVLAWDFGRAAARAVADAMPLMRQAKEVRIVTVLADKQAPASASGPELVAHLARNGVHATLNELERGRRGVGEVLEEAAGDADLMVMGAFGHSRIRDFFLGGATRHVLGNPRRPTLLSH
mgnify:CR=1 FL=1